MTRWWYRRVDECPPTSRRDSWVALGAGVVCGRRVETHQRVIMTRWWYRRGDECPATSRRDSWVALGPVWCAGGGLKPTNESLRLVGGIGEGMNAHPRVVVTRG